MCKKHNEEKKEKKKEANATKEGKSRGRWDNERGVTFSGEILDINNSKHNIFL